MGQVSQQHVEVFSGEAGADLSAKQYYFVKLNASGQVVIYATAGEAAIGVLMNEPAASGRAAEVALPGSVVPVQAGGSFTAGDRITGDANGKAVALTPPAYVDTQAGSATDPLLGKYMLGWAVTDGASGSLAQVLLVPPSATLTVT